VQTNVSLATNSLVISQEKVAEYNRLCGLLETLGKKEQELVSYLTPSNPVLASVQQQMAHNQKLKQQMEDENPGFRVMKHAESTAAPGNGASATRTDPILAMAEAAGFRSKISIFTNRLAELQTRAAALEDAESSIAELERRRDREEGYYTNFSATREQSQINERLGSGKVSNIYEIQAPSTPWKVGTKLRKMMAMVLFGAVALGFGIAFGIEYFLDQSLRRPGDIETKLGLHLFMTVPRLGFENGISVPDAAKQRRMLPESAGSSEEEKQSEVNGNGANGVSGAVQLAPWDPSHGLRPFSEALRDRLITHFELLGLIHKPKLVAVTSCGEGCGVSTIAAGLAASLSETGEGNVLLVDMNIENGAAHQFHHGDLSCSIDDALETQKRENALVQENLYVVAETSNSEKLPSVVPRRFRELVPKLKASDYDYIIFDMPPVSQVSLTPRLARFMDMVLMVVESGKTDRELARKAASLLVESKAEVGVVLNKTRKYVPKALQQEL
jgi:Mrp family chromosome partitioning ATPase